MKRSKGGKATRQTGKGRNGKVEIGKSKKKKKVGKWRNSYQGGGKNGRE